MKQTNQSMEKNPDGDRKKRQQFIKTPSLKKKTKLLKNIRHFYFHRVPFQFLNVSIDYKFFKFVVFDASR